MAVTQKDVARLAAVSPRTVSNVINDFAHVRPEVRARVREAIADLGYRPNRAAQELRTGRSRVIGLAVPELDVGYFGEIARALVEDAATRGYATLIAQTLGDLTREVEALEGFAEQQLDGVLLSAICVTAEQIGTILGDCPIVLLGEQLLDSTYDHVAIDNVAAARAVVAHMIGTGRRQIGFIGEMRGADLVLSDLRLKGYRLAHDDFDLPFKPGLVRTVTGYHRADGYAATQSLVRSEIPFDGLFCANDLLAFGAIRALVDCGFQLPRDVGVAGFDDLDDARFSVPRLTTASPHKAELAQAALDLLLSPPVPTPRQSGRSLGAKAFDLVVRESTASASG
jgi:DNA-binding LacI/PurR family transcriptional regulator